MEGLRQQGRSLAETPSYLVASVVTVLVFVCLFVERSIYRFGRVIIRTFELAALYSKRNDFELLMLSLFRLQWLKETKRKALFASLEKIKEELMLLGLISLLLAQWANWFSQICVSSSLFSSKFYLCSEEDFDSNKAIISIISLSSLNATVAPPKGLNALASNQCGEGREPFVSYEGLEQLHRFLFVLGITHVFYSFVAVGLAMSKIYSWKKWENLRGLSLTPDGDMQAKKTKVMTRQSTFVFHHTSHPWSRNRILIWILCFLRQFRSSIQKSDYLALRQGFIIKHNLPSSYNFHKYMVRSMEDEFQGILGISWPLWGYAIACIFINIHGSNIYFWLSFIPAILVMLVGMKLEHVVSLLALEIMDPTGPMAATQVKPRDDLFWFRKPEIMLHLIQFIIFQNAFEMATFIWSLWGFKQRSCFMKNHLLVIIRLASGVLVQFWCSNSTVPLNVIVTQMGSRCKKALVAESVRESLHSWCKRVKARSKRGSQSSYTVRSVCSIESTIDEITVVSGTLSRTSSLASMNQDTITSIEQLGGHVLDMTSDRQDEISSRIEEFLSESLRLSAVPPETDPEGDAGIGHEDDNEETLEELLKTT